MRAISRLYPFLLFLVPAFAGAQPALEVDVVSRLASTPLHLDLHLDAATDVTVRIDGTPVALPEATTLEPGESRIVLRGLDLGAGSHRVEVAAGGARAETDFRLLPGWFSVLPPVIAIVLALISRNVLVSLFLGIFGGTLILFDWNPIAAFARTTDRFLVPALVDADHIAIILFTTLLGGMVGLITKSAGTHGIIDRLKPYATNPRRGQLATWAMGVMVFFDDYANTLIVGPTMRPITDKLKISREKLAYIVDSTAAPVVCLLPISTWVGFEIGLIGDAFEQLGLPYDAYGSFVSSIPYRFYPIFALVLGFTIAATRIDFGPMRKAELRAMNKGQVIAPGDKPIADYGGAEIEPDDDTPRRAINALVPIATVAVVTALGLFMTGAANTERGDGPLWLWLRDVLQNANSYTALMWASLTAVTLALVLPVSQRILKLEAATTAMVAGFKSMLMALVVLTLAWSLSGVCSELGTADYLTGLASDNVAPTWLPAITFLLAAAIAFATGSSWSTIGILEPLVIPIAHNLALGAGLTMGSDSYNAILLGSIATVLAGSVWGDHCSPISDTTILSSMATGCDHIAHVRTQLPYALAVGGVAIGIGTVPTAYGLPPWISLVAGASLIVGTVLIAGRRRGAGA